jgi:hypothetical protein
MVSPSRSAALVDQIQRLVGFQAYRVGLHAVRHMIEEGFDEDQVIEALNGRIRVLEEYPEEHRCLLLGRFRFSPSATSALHILRDLTNEMVLDIVTAYIPQRPWWATPTLRGRRK